MTEQSQSRETTSAPAPGARRLSGAQLLLGLTVFFLIVVLAVRGGVAWWYHAQLAMWEAEGAPLSMAELWDVRTAGEPGAIDLYQELFEAAERETERWRRLVDPTRAGGPPADVPALTDEQRELAEEITGNFLHNLGPSELDALQVSVVERYLSTHARSRELAHEGAAAGGATRMPRDRDDYVQAMLVPYLGELRAVMRALGAEGALHASRGETEAAVASLEAASYLPRLLRNEPTQIDGLVHDATWGHWARMASSVLSRVAVEEEDLLRLIDAAERAAPRPGEDDRRLVLISIAQLEEWQRMRQHDMPGPISFAYRLTGWGQFTDGYYLSHLYGLLDPLRIESEPERLEAVHDYNARELPIWAMEVDLMLPLTDRILGVRYRSIAMSRATQAGLAAMRFHLNENRLPNDLEELVQAGLLEAVPLDPFTGDPLIYRIEDEGFVVYSINENLVDSGGDGSNDARNAEADDVPFRIRLPQ